MSWPGPDPQPEGEITHWQEMLILAYVIGTFGALLFLWPRLGALVAVGSYVVFTAAVLLANKYIWEPWRTSRRAHLAASGRLEVSSKHEKRRTRRIPVLSSVYDFLASPPPKWLDRILQTSCQSNGVFLLVSLTTVIVLIHLIVG